MNRNDAKPTSPIDSRAVDVDPARTGSALGAAGEPASAQLSALLDGALEPGATRFLYKRLEHDRVLRMQWTRWHLAGACLRHAPVAVMPEGFPARVAAALAQEPALRRGFGPALRWTGGAAVAASVALLALLAARPPLGPASDPQAEPVLAASGAVAESPLREADLRPQHARVPARTVAATQSQQIGRAGAGQPGTAFLSDPRIEAYLVRHNQAVQAQGRSSFLPYVYVVAQPEPGTVRPASAAADGRN